uniref:ABC transporter domain-containing protein n=1 Tax=Fagus sylvatica TaxID=28930 RepID=A0A2N9HMF1_FAGSY
MFGLMLLVLVTYSVQLDHIVQLPPADLIAVVECFKLNSCSPDTANQKIKAYGILVLVGLSTMLMIIYHCSDQVLTTRQRRVAKHREAAARSAKETAKASQSWKTAKHAAKKHASGLQAHLSSMFSPKKDVKDPEKLQVSDEAKSDIDDDPLPCPQSIALGTSLPSIVTSVEDKKEPNEMMPEIEDDQESYQGFSIGAGDKSIKKCPKGKTDSFANFQPGRITAVLGPSGAGKTTFLSAVAGKAIGCTMSGSILINGKNDSIHSYKKIIGFVPQDDIVHGNLTVEENFWFSAKFSEDILGWNSGKARNLWRLEKESKCWIGNGHGTFTVDLKMNPHLVWTVHHLYKSLEPFDVKLLKGYVLFNMFDDLILLAKGGLIVYHGPVKKVEEYFASLGINILERVNPPEHLIDIVEGIVISGGSSGVSHEDLAVRWMLHNGYSAPTDMLQNAAGLARSSMGVIPASETNPAGIGMEEHSFSGELWQSMKSKVELQRDKIQLYFLNSKDLTNRTTPGVFQQYK